MANEQFRLVGITGGAAGRIPGDFTEREEMMDALAEAQSSAKFDTITVQKRTKSPTTGKFSSWVDAEKFPGNRLRQEAAEGTAAGEPPAPTNQLPEKIKYCVQAIQNGEWKTIITTDDKMVAAKKAQEEMANTKNSEISLTQYDENSTAPDRGVKSLVRKALNHAQNSAAAVVEKVSNIDTSEVRKKVSENVEALKAKAAEIDTDEVRKKLERNVQAVKDAIPDDVKRKTKGFYTRWRERASEPGAKPNWKDMLIVFFIISFIIFTISIFMPAVALILSLILMAYSGLWYKNKVPAMIGTPYPHPYGGHIAKVAFFAGLLSAMSASQSNKVHNPATASAGAGQQTANSSSSNANKDGDDDTAFYNKWVAAYNFYKSPTGSDTWDRDGKCLIDISQVLSYVSEHAKDGKYKYWLTVAQNYSTVAPQCFVQFMKVRWRDFRSNKANSYTGLITCRSQKEVVPLSLCIKSGPLEITTNDVWHKYDSSNIGKIEKDVGEETREGLRVSLTEHFQIKAPNRSDANTLQVRITSSEGKEIYNRQVGGNDGIAISDQ